MGRTDLAETLEIGPLHGFQRLSVRDGRHRRRGRRRLACRADDDGGREASWFERIQDKQR